ncbi:gluconolaconase [Sphingomonas sp. AAP5]|uniref:L-dopachrome tautomerase-related protein n=1 Tax=Sphingomonas sp. AAP5 TaxID=1523415 RepID=UPI001056FC11|nr:L-dopachrome tautomerase-related protein [Sphingomonas sp. AAP5]QBM75615.1 gluconolaconase [Sphingomonas sp. AAP5]
MTRRSLLRTALRASAITLVATAAIGALARRPSPSPSPSPVERIATFGDAMPTGVTVAANGRIFVNYPQWGDNPRFTVGELKNGVVTAYPDQAINQADSARPGETLISVQSVVADSANRLWILDTAAPNFAAPIAGGAKLVAVDLARNRVVQTIVLGPDVVLPTTYLNDVRFDLRQGIAGVAYITDSSVTGPGAIIVVDLASGAAVRRLSGDATTMPDPAFAPVVEGKPVMTRPADGPAKPWKVAADGIALSPDGATLYYSPLSSRHLYAVPTALLRDPVVDPAKLSAAVCDLGLKGASDGLAVDSRGRIYGGDYEHNAIRRLADGKWETIAQDRRILWPDTLSIGTDGYLYFTANQLHRQPGFHKGKDLRRKPYELLRIKIDAGPA